MSRITARPSNMPAACRPSGTGSKPPAHSRAAAKSIHAIQRISSPCQTRLAITPMKFGISFTATFMNQAGALVIIYRDGSVQVNHGGTEMGQGLHTKIAQIAAEGLGVAARSHPRDADPHGQSSQHVRDGRLRQHGSERRRGARRLHATQKHARPLRRNSRDAVRDGCSRGLEKRFPCSPRASTALPEFSTTPPHSPASHSTISLGRGGF